MELPITHALPELLQVLQTQGAAVLHAPPGAGKTTMVPLALLSAKVFERKLVMLEPRRLAARAAAERMAQILGEAVGETVGYRMRGAAKSSPATRIEVVTEGILTAMIQSDPGLTDIDCIIFDEFHERSIAADLGLALTLEVRAALRPDLKLLVMSATLDALPVAALMDNAPLVQAPGHAFDVEIVWRKTPAEARAPLEAQLAPLIFEALERQPMGSGLIFLPGAAEIRRLSARLDGHVPENTKILPLYGALPFAQQQQAVAAPAKGMRHLVLATSIAETSLTLPDVRFVVDGGRTRRARYDPTRAMARLVTEWVSKAEAKQRTGRAGRVAPGMCFRNWMKAEEGKLTSFPPPEIEIGDLTSLALELARWGDPMGQALKFLTPPAAGSIRAAHELLGRLGAIASGQITAHGHALAKVPVHPRLGHMVLMGGPGAADLAALLQERDSMPQAGVDVMERLKTLQEARVPWAQKLRPETKRLKRYESGAALSSAQQAALAFPDRVGLRRPGDAPRWQLSGGGGAYMNAGESLANQRLIVAVDLDGERREARVRLACALSNTEFRELYKDQIHWRARCFWDARAKRVKAQREECFEALVLDTRPWPGAPPEARTQAALDGIRDLGLAALNWSKSALRLRARLAISGRDMSDDALTEALEDWAGPFMPNVQTADDIATFDPTIALESWLGWQALSQLDRDVPSHYRTPLGRKVAIDYAGGVPEVTVRLQEVFGETQHPTIGPNALALRMVLLSPGGKPIQVTQDLPRFWAGSYADVRKEMRGRYPKHPWPEDPTKAQPTLQAKSRADKN